MYCNQIHYIRVGNGPNNIVFLHGWGGNYRSFFHIGEYFGDDYSLYFIDLPGFGYSQLLKPYHLSDYAFKIIDFIDKLNINNPTIVGHSFGGRITLKMLEIRHFKAILVSTPGYYRKSLKTRIKLFLNRFTKLSFPSDDFKNSSPMLKLVMKNILTDTKYINFKKINSGTLLIHGINDNIVKIKDAKKLKKDIKGELIKLECGHFPQNEYPYLLYKVINSYASCI